MKPPNPHRTRNALLPASLLWGAFAGSRNFLYDTGLARVHRLEVPVVSLGNITVGGTGKTPLTIHLARRLLAIGIRPLALSRGYRSSGSGTRVVSDGETVRLGPREAGDEPVLMARSVPGLPVVVDPDRVRGGREGVRRFRPDIVLLDDGFQHRRLGRDLDVVLLDAMDPFGRYAMLPSGLLREPFAGLSRADVFVVTHAPRGEPLETLTAVLRRYNSRAPIVRAWHVTDRLVPLGSAPAPPDLAGGPIYAFCGIGNPEGFRATLRASGARLAGFEVFRDHHPYSEAEIERIARSARDSGATLVVTTEKDGVRLAGTPDDPPFFALALSMKLDPEELLLGPIRALVPSRRSAEWPSATR